MLRAEKYSSSVSVVAYIGPTAFCTAFLGKMPDDLTDELGLLDQKSTEIGTLGARFSCLAGL